jgi:hypothetical protein
MAKELPEYQEWDSLVNSNREHWQYYLNLYSYALQKPSKPFLTSWMYPGFYQERLLYRDYAAAMQRVGDVKPQEIAEFSRLTGDPSVAKTYKYINSGPLHPSMLWNPLGAALGLILTLLAARVKKPKVWYFVPAWMVYGATIGLENRFHMLKLGTLVDLAEWTAEQRKAKIWLAEKKFTTSGLPTAQQMEKQLIDLVTQFKG